MGLADVVHHLAGEYIQYEKHSVAYATLSTAVGFAGGLALGYYAVAYGVTNVLAALSIGIGGYIASRWAAAFPLHLKNIYNLVVGKYSGEAKKPAAAPANLAPAPAT